MEVRSEVEERRGAWAHVGPSWAYVGPLLGLCWAIFVKPTVLHLAAVQILDLPRPQNLVKHRVFEHHARKSQRHSGRDPASASQRQGIRPTRWRRQLASKSPVDGWQLVDDN